MEDMQRRFRDELDSVKQRWGGSLGLQRTAPRYAFSKMRPVQRVVRAAGGHATRAETLYEHIQDEVAAMSGQAGEGEYPVVLYSLGAGDLVQVGSIGYRNPDLLVIEGVDGDNQRTRVLVQGGSAQFILKTVKLEPEAEKPSTEFTFAGEMKRV